MVWRKDEFASRHVMPIMTGLEWVLRYYTGKDGGSILVLSMELAATFFGLGGVIMGDWTGSAGKCREDRRSLETEVEQCALASAIVISTSYVWIKSLSCVATSFYRIIFRAVVSSFYAGQTSSCGNVSQLFQLLRLNALTINW